MSESPTADHNLKARKVIINEVCRDICMIDDQITELQTEKTKIKNTKIKGDLGMKITDFNIALRVYKLEGDDRDTLFDTLKECFQALGVGEQLNFLDSVGAEKTVVSKKGKKPKPEDLGEKVNQPHQPIQTDQEFEAAAPKPIEELRVPMPQTVDDLESEATEFDSPHGRE